MFDPLRTSVKNAVPALGQVYARLVRARANLVDLYYAYRPFSQSLPEPTPYGFKLGGGNSVHHRTMQQGTFEPEEVAVIEQCLASAEVFVDVGANVGFYSCLARGRGKQVVAIEPQAANLKHLYANLLANGWADVEVHPMGLGASPGLASLFGASSTGASLIPGWAGASRRFRQTIPISTLDSVVGTRFSGKKLVIKIDVEGVEHALLRGARETLVMTPKPTWLIEICLAEYDPRGQNANYEEIFQLFWVNGYEAHTADRGRHLVTQAAVARAVRVGRAESDVINYLFTPV